MQSISTNTKTALLTDAPAVQPLPEVIYHKHKALTTSLAVAKFFGKQHKNILRAIENLECSPTFNELNFELVKYTDEKGERRPMYRMTRSGFVFLAMGFTGKKAAQFKEAYITRFDEMERWIVSRESLAKTNDRLGDAVKFYLQATGATDPHAYSREHTLIYCVVLGCSRKTWLEKHGLPPDSEIRNHLSQTQLDLIDVLIPQSAAMLNMMMTYKDRKNALTEFALRFITQSEQVAPQGGSHEIH
ncbi:Rha family transcriptional regulator [Testudinibacter sp. P27/CKL/0425]